MVKCNFENCKKRALYNIEGLKPLYCGIHKEFNMINVINKLCIELNCDIRPTYNYKNENIGLYCNSHKKDGMIDVIHNYCLELDCDIRPNYNYKNENIGLYCNSHKKDDMINVISKRCLELGCDIIPTYNYKNEKQALYCNSHKKDGMIDIKSKKCIELNCKKRPLYNYKKEKNALYCNMHKKDEMIDVIHKYCLELNCEKQPSYNYENEKMALYCKMHKKNGMIDVISKRCKTYLCYTRANKKYDGYCLFCYIHMFPDKPVCRNYKTKEQNVVEVIFQYFHNFSWIADKRIENGYSLRRPDLILDLGYQVIIVEIDENQHIDYDCSCENKRIMQLSLDVNHRNMIFIRFNPDDYININNKKIKSPWKLNGNSILVVNDTIEWSNRLEALKNQIDYWINPDNKTTKLVEIVQLFYDEI